MMKETVKTILLIVLTILVISILIKTNRQLRVTSQEKQPETVLTDTITNIVYDTVFLVKYETVKLPTDTLIIINDSIRIDSIEVEIPISSYLTDTTITTDSTKLNLSIRNTGYHVTLDTLIYNFKYTPTVKKKSFRENFKLGVGVSTGYGVFTKKPDVFLGVGFFYVF